MRQPQHLPLWRDANRLLLPIEQAVRDFDAGRPGLTRCAQPAVAQMRSRRICPRRHKYSLVKDMRRLAMTISQLVRRAAPREDQVARVTRLVEAVDDLKLQIQLGNELQAFQSFKQFQAITDLAVVVGKQSGSLRNRLPIGVTSLSSQVDWFRQSFAADLQLNAISPPRITAVRLSNCVALFGDDAERTRQRLPWAWRGRLLAVIASQGAWPRAALAGLPYLFAAEDCYLPGGMKRRVLRDLHIGPGARSLIRVPA